MGTGEVSKGTVVTIEVGFFSMSHVNKIAGAENLFTAKQIALDAIKAKPTAKTNNIAKANQMVANAKSVQGLAIAVTNFMLAHPSEGLGMNSNPPKKERKPKHG
jgi:hypothetical protein